MSDLAHELATLVADTLAAAESWRATGAGVVGVGRLDGLPAAEPWPAAPPRPAAGARPGPGHAPAAFDRPAPFERPAPARPVDPPRRVDPRPEPAPSLRAAPPERVVPRVEPPAPSATRAPPPAAAPSAPTASAPTAPAGGGLAGLFGNKWAVALRDRAAEVDTVLAGLGTCPDCGTSAVDLRGSGKADASLVVLATGPGARPLGPEGGAMLERMLLNVLSVERSDVWLLEANGCAAGGGTCKGAIRRQIDAVSPRLVLLVGAGGGAVLGGIPPVKGEWSPWGSADVLATFHPLELLERPGDKRAAMEHLTTLRRRM